MSKVLSVLLSSACIAFSSLSHSATTLISFDDVALNGSGAGGVANGYNGLNWTNVNAANPFVAFRINGAANGIISLSNVAYNTSTSGIRFSAQTATPFTFNSAHFSSFWNDDLTLTVAGVSRGVIVDTASFTVGTQGSTLKQFDWANLDSVTISSSGGTHRNGLDGSGTNFAFDDMTINGPVAAVPEATTYMMMLAGLGILGIAGLRRKKA